MATFSEGGLFTEFIDSFLKLKQEASGYPEWFQNDEDKKKYVEDYFRHEAIQWEPSKIAKSAGYRLLSKAILNSFWGKLGQRKNQATTIGRDPEQLFAILTNPSNQVNSIKLINWDVVVVNWQYIKGNW